jgi:phosphatidylglycerol---prolipoprotein diacylglyceryl transferase
MVFPNGGPEPRHPSQLYEAGLEGIALFLIINALERFTAIRLRPGALSGVFLIGYGVARSIAELFREPDAFLGYLAFGLTMGQWLSLPLIVVGLILLLRPQRRPAAG